MLSENTSGHIIKICKENKKNIPHNLKEFYTKFVSLLEEKKFKSKNNGNSKIVNILTELLGDMLSKKGFIVKTEVDLYNPSKKIPFIKNVLKEDFKNFKNSKRIDIIAYRNKGERKILFIEIKNKIGTNAMLSGLFELSMIDGDAINKIPEGYKPYFILLSFHASNPKKYEPRFETIKNILFKDEDIKELCTFVLLDPRDPINLTKFYNEILS